MLRKHLIQLAAFVVAVVLVILGLTVNLERIKSWVSGTRIIVASSTRGDVGEYLAGEVLKLSLQGVQSPRVFWVFDEGQPIVGAVEAQYAFPFDAQTPTGQARDRRVDAFFKSGDAYRTASTLVRTRNVNYSASVGVDESGIVVTAPADFGTEWSLTRASLALFAEGKFTKHERLTRGPEAKPDQFVATRKDTQRAFGYTESIDLPSVLKSDRRAWTWYDFTNKATGATLTVAKPVTVEPQM